MDIEREIAQPAVELGEKLLALGWQVTAAESCTGGGIAQAITSAAGSSDWFERGFVTYSNRAKQEMLGVDGALIESNGAVSQPVVEAMALGALKAAGAQLSVAVSGVAGPGGGSAAKPVGTVWIAWADASGVCEAHCYHFDGDRAQVRLQTVKTALTGLISRAAAGG